MHHGYGRRFRATHVLALLVVLGAVAGFVSYGFGTVIPGGGPTKSDCFVELDVQGTKTTTSTKLLECTDGDPTCDQDGQCNDSCLFKARLCIDQPGMSGCTPAASLRKLKSKFSSVPPRLDGSACGAFVDQTVAVKVKGSKKKARTVKIKAAATAAKGTKPGKDSDTYQLRCLPRVGACPTTTTTIATTTTVQICTTTTTIPSCGNGVVEAGEQCDPPCNTNAAAQGGCSGGQVCSGLCQCIPASGICTCGASAPKTFSFTTNVGAGNCGSVTDVNNCSVLDLTCAGLYFGGAADAVPLPATIPDMGHSINNITACNDTCLTLAASTQLDTGSNRDCTSKDCFFGAPLPIPNTAAVPLSTCIMNVIAQDATGFGKCDTGDSFVNLPLNSLVFLFGDLLNGSAADRPDVPGIQPCPICVSGQPVTGTCTTGTCCKGGPNHGKDCVPGTSPLGDPYPTSQDCPPPGAPGQPPFTGQPVGQLPIPFALTTGASVKKAAALGTEQRVFCGFCRDANDTGCFQGDPNAATHGCPVPAGSLHPCTSNSDCAEPYEACEQKDNGAFRQGGAALIAERGSPGGNLADGAAHASKLVSVFCIPPTYNAAIDGAADLPGPGAVSLPGSAQLLQ